MDVIADVVTSGVLPLQEYAMRTERTFPAVLERAGRGVVRNVIAITPPASASGVEGGLDSSSQAKARGARAIERDLWKVFAPVRLKNKRREAISGAQLVQIHQRHLSAKRPGAPMRRDRSQPYYVDGRKFNLLANKLRSHVGRLAAGWIPAAQGLNVPVAGWISRHGLGRGTYRAAFEGRAMFIEAVNLASPHAPADELRRRVGYALNYQANAMRREMQYLMARDAAGAGLVVAA